MYDSIHVSFHSSTSSTYDGDKNLDSYQQKVPLGTMRASLMHKIQQSPLPTQVHEHIWEHEAKRNMIIKSQIKGNNRIRK